ncbi:Hypothetical predicted protein, partial [Mytilus galloprovincialis]
MGMYNCSQHCNKQSDCLQINTKNEKTLLSFKTSSLDNSVAFVDPSGKYHRYCPSSFYGDRENCSKHVTQNRISNVTTLTLNNPFDISNFGKWKCFHGPNHVCDTSTVIHNNCLRFKPDAETTSSSSDFYGQALSIDSGFFFQFTCKMFQIPVDNSLTFLVNEKTVDILRFEKLDCYNIKGKCTENSCSCSLSTNTFQWFYSISTSLKKMIFEVQARYADMSTGKIVKVSLSRTFYSEDFGTLKMRTDTIRPGINESSWKDNKKSDIDMSVKAYQTVPLIVGIVFVLLVSFVILIIIARQCHVDNENEGQFTHSYENSVEDICTNCSSNPAFIICNDCHSLQCIMCRQKHKQKNRNYCYVKIRGRTEIHE